MYSPSSRPGSVIWQVVLLIAVLAPVGVRALEGDQQEPIRLTADHALRDEKKGFTVYSGNVRMDQGSLHLEADKLTIYHLREEADKIVAEGRPARLNQQPDPAKGLVHASANTIEYFKLENRVHLRDNAYIEQDGSTVSGETIDYFIQEQRVKADSDASKGGNRVQVVIPATQLQKSGDDSGAINGK